MVSVLRKLAIACFSFSAAVFLACYLLPPGARPWLAAGLALCALLLLLTRQRWLHGFLISAFALAFGFLLFFLHAQRTLVPALASDGETLEIRGEVCSYPQLYEDYSRVELRLDGQGLPGGKLILYAEGDALAAFSPGDTLSCTARLKRADERYGERYDPYLARGVYLTGNAKGVPERIPGKTGFRYFPLLLQRRISAQVDRLFPADTAAFMKSLMLGDKQDLYQDQSLYLAMNRAGLMHVVAVSGMHISFLVGFLQLLLGKTRRCSLLCLCFVWLFVCITGAPPSAVRAAVMQSFLLLAPMVDRENDPVTSLSAAMALILLANPFAAGSIGLQLSFSAMAGILFLAEPLNSGLSALFPEHWRERLRAPISTAASSLAVLSFSAPLMVLHFHALSLLSPLSNVMGLWAVSLCFCGGYLTAFLGAVFLPLGRAAAWLVSWLARCLFLVARGISSLPFAMLYLRSLPSYLWILLVYALALLFSRSRLRAWLRFLLPTLLSVGMLTLLLLRTDAHYTRPDGLITAVDVGQGQSLVLMREDETLVIDCGSIFTLENAGEQTGAYLISCGRSRVDTLILTHLHADHCNGVPMLMEMLPVTQLILPADVEDEDGCLGEILDAAAAKGTKVAYVSQAAETDFGGIHARLFPPLSEGDANERCMMGVFSIGSYDMLVTGDAPKAAEKELLTRCSLRELELLIVGHHGSRYSSSGELLGSIGADTALISVGYNTFGHPTYETLERLSAYGYRIYRTDLNGTVEIFLGN